MTKLKSLPKSLRPREKLMARGVENLSKSELLAILLGSGTKEKNVIELARSILKTIGSPSSSRLTPEVLTRIQGMGQAKTCTVLSALELGKRLFSTAKNDQPIINKLDAVLEQASDLKWKQKEYLIGLFLNSRQELIKKEEIAVGGLNTNLLSPADLFRPALSCGASQIILIHNHPSGDSLPSIDDWKLTVRLVEAGKVLGIQIVDHVIVARNESLSLRQVKKKMFE